MGATMRAGVWALGSVGLGECCLIMGSSLGWDGHDLLRPDVDYYLTFDGTCPELWHSGSGIVTTGL